ncbi:hypothetical protein [Rhizobium sp. CF142]|uniref:hypothetical protein n=1 Tax=Rhizobium sp. CF142 TaxID=1144314 RepID=UPI00026EFF18|nr:hypothetical protein [Rhizobium sp. CF142]EJJ28068.1 hypothetical protein PMI11_03672 [Rhizobium sp. CF142]
MIDYSAGLLVVLYVLVFFGMRAGRQSVIISLLWPAMFGFMLADKLHKLDKENGTSQQ